MMLPIHTQAWPRAALIGNPSDGYFGKTIAVVFSNFAVNFMLRPHERIVLQDGRLTYNRIDDLVESVSRLGYDREMGLLQAAIKVFHDFCLQTSVPLYQTGLHFAFETTIPRCVGLAGSSAIVMACIRALLQLHRITLPAGMLANLVLKAEQQELKIEAGLQDRVVQAFECPVFMDFSQPHFEQHQTGVYRPISRTLLPPLYIAWKESNQEDSNTTLSSLRQRFDNGDESVHRAIARFAALTDRFWIAMQVGDVAGMSQLMDQNFDLRASLVRISSPNLELINAARKTGASAKFTGSGGSIVGIYQNEQMLHDLRQAMKEAGAQFLIPDVLDREPNS